MPGPEPRAGLLVQNTFLLHHSCFSAALRFWSFTYSNANISCALYFFTDWSLLYRVNGHGLAMSEWSTCFKTLFSFCLNFWCRPSLLPTTLTLLALGDAPRSNDEVTEFNRPEESLPIPTPTLGKSPASRLLWNLCSWAQWESGWSHKSFRSFEKAREVVCLPIITPMRINMINIYLQIIYHFGEVGTVKWAWHCKVKDRFCD